MVATAGFTPKILLDARCLQDPDYRYRGVGHHSVSVIASMRRVLGDVTAAALYDPLLPPLETAHVQMFDCLYATPPDARRKPDIFIQLSPMTHPAMRLRRVLHDNTIFKLAIAYDLIPLMEPERYLAMPAAWASFVANLGWAQYYDRLAALSEFTAAQFIHHLRIQPERLYVSGCAVRPSLIDHSSNIAGYADRSGIVITGGGDPRKNPDCAIIAHARSARSRQERVVVIVTGNYGSAERQRLRALAAAHGGDPELISFTDIVSDAEMAALFRAALVVVVPSRAEGFSLPPIEANANGAVVLASDATAHLELLPDRAHRFGVDDDEELRLKLEPLLFDDDAWSNTRNAQGDFWRHFTAESVGQRFWSPVATHIEALRTAASRPSSPAIAVRARPRLAVVTPLRPALSGIADYSARFVDSLSQVADVEVFTSAPGALSKAFAWPVSPLSSRAWTASTFDRTVTVLGNSTFHLDAFAHFMDYGGACVAHDARMIDFYYHDMGVPKAQAVASKEAGRPVDQGEIRRWLFDQSQLKYLFLSEICERADPLFVHSADMVGRIRQAYGTSATLLPFVPYGPVKPSDVTQAAISAARQRCGVAPDEIVVATFGIVSPDKAPLACLRACADLKARGKRVRLVYCGYAPGGTASDIRDAAAAFGDAISVTLIEKPVAVDVYGDWLLAADIGLQLRTYTLGQISGALTDCIGAALPTVSNDSLAAAIPAPAFVSRVGDALDPGEITGALEAILAKPDRPINEAQFFAERHSFAAYCKRMLEALGFALA